MSTLSWTVHSLYQPVVDLDSLAVVGYEALVRGVPGSSTASAPALFASAIAADDVDGLEWACRAAAMRGVLEAGLTLGTALFLNAEPATFSLDVPRHVVDLADALDARGVPVVVEITERDLARDPQALFWLRDMLDERGWLLAIDDVGADPASLAMLPMLDPDVIKLDMSLVQQQPDLRVARVMNAVNAQVALTGARVVAEGVETARQRDHAVSIGATLAQGWLLGRPAPLPRVSADPCTSSALASLGARRSRTPSDPATVWALVESSSAVRTSRPPMLRAMSRHLESQTLTGDDATVVLTAYQDADSLVGRTLATYEAISRFAFFVGVLGHGVVTEPLPGLRGVDLPADDPLGREWDVVIVTPHFAAALIATEVESSPPAVGDDRVFRYVLTYDRALVLQAARILLRRFDASTQVAVLPVVDVGVAGVSPADLLAAPHARHVEQEPDLVGHGPTALEVLVQDAGRREDVLVHYQPVVAGHDGETVHAVEALLRLDDGRGRPLPARVFLGFAERLGLVPVFAARLLDEACAQMALWRDELDDLAPATVHVNVGRGDHVDAEAFTEVVARHGLPPGAVGLEFVRDPSLPVAVPPALRRLAERGHPVTLDRCRDGAVVPTAPGTRPPDHVKVDRSLVAVLTTSRAARATVRAIVETAHAVGATVVGVGVETAQQRILLHELGCDLAQGTAVCRPRPAAELEAWLLARSPGEQARQGLGTAGA